MIPLWYVTVRSLYVFSSALLILAVLLSSSILALRIYFRVLRQTQTSAAAGKQEVGLFHPDSTSGGGSEKVLWAMTDALMHAWPDAEFTVYMHWPVRGGPAPCESAVQRFVADKFGITLLRPAKIVELRSMDWIEPSSYPHLTLLLQSLGAVPLAWEALTSHVPDIFIDTMGLALSYPFAKICCGCRVACYVHFPVLSADMLAEASAHPAKFNQAGPMLQSEFRALAKSMYYKFFASLYGSAGRQSDVIMVNSSWTKRRIMEIWSVPSDRVHCVYPPCNVKQLNPLSTSPVRSGAKEWLIVSIGQFRSEKDHALQLRVLKLLLDRYNYVHGSSPPLFLHLIGGARNREDEARVLSIRKMSEELKIAEHVHFHVNLSYSDLLVLLERGSIGLHTMHDEHFGIGVVECMASGCIPVAHNSAGPKTDIVAAGCGFLATTAEEYADSIMSILAMAPRDRMEMRQQGKHESQRFSDENFGSDVRRAMVPLLFAD